MKNTNTIGMILSTLAHHLLNCSMLCQFSTVSSRNTQANRENWEKSMRRSSKSLCWNLLMSPNIGSNRGMNNVRYVEVMGMFFVVTIVPKFIIYRVLTWVKFHCLSLSANLVRSKLLQEISSRNCQIQRRR